MEKRRYRANLIFILVVGCCFASLVCFVPISTNFTYAETKNNLKVHFIDVGQGDSIFCELPDGKTMLIDAGTTEMGERVVDYIKDLKYSTIDIFVVTHADIDHSGGASKILEEFEVKNIFRPLIVAYSSVDSYEDDILGVVDSDEVLISSEPCYLNFIKACYNETGATVTTISNNCNNSCLFSENNDYFIEFIAPFAVGGVSEFVSDSGKTKGFLTDYYEDDNVNSAVVLLDCFDKTFMFCADATIETENKIIEYANENEIFKERISNIDVLKVAHHGSSGSSGLEFLTLLNPDYAIISVGAGNEYGHPVGETINNLHKSVEKIYRTDKSGHIIVKVASDGKLTIKTRSSETIFAKPWFIYLGLGLIVLAIITISVVYIVKDKKSKKIIKEEIPKNDSDK